MVSRVLFEEDRRRCVCPALLRKADGANRTEDIEVAKERLKRLNEQKRAKERRQTRRSQDEGKRSDELNMSDQDRLELK